MTKESESENETLEQRDLSLIKKYSSLRAFIIYSLLFEFIYLGFWIVPFKIKPGKFDSILVLILNVVIIAAVWIFFETYKKILKPLISYSPKENGKIDSDYIAKVNDFRKNVNLVVSVESILISFSSILFLISLCDAGFFKTVSDQLKYLSLGTIAPMILFALKAENSLDEIYWRYDTQEYKSQMEIFLEKKTPKKVFFRMFLVVVIAVIVLFILWHYKVTPTWWLLASSILVALGLKFN